MWCVTVWHSGLLPLTERSSTWRRRPSVVHKSELRPLFSKRSPDNSKSRYRRREVDCVVCFKLCWRPETDARLACKGRGRGRGGLTGQTQDFCTRKWSLFPLYVILFQSMILSLPPFLNLPWLSQETYTLPEVPRGSDLSQHALFSGLIWAFCTLRNQNARSVF